VTIATPTGASLVVDERSADPEEVGAETLLDALGSQTGIRPRIGFASRPRAIRRRAGARPNRERFFKSTAYRAHGS
jgi:hypothetical protein